MREAEAARNLVSTFVVDSEQEDAVWTFALAYCYCSRTTLYEDEEVYVERRCAVCVQRVVGGSKVCPVPVQPTSTIEALIYKKYYKFNFF